MTLPPSALERLRELLARATPELFTSKPHRIAQMLRDGAHAQVPKADNITEVDFETDGECISAVLRAAPALLARIGELEKGLEPFVAVVEDYEEHGAWQDLDDDYALIGRIRRSRQEAEQCPPPRITVGDLRHARTLVKHGEAE